MENAAASGMEGQREGKSIYNLFYNKKQFRRQRDGTHNNAINT